MFQLLAHKKFLLASGAVLLAAAAATVAATVTLFVAPDHCTEPRSQSFYKSYAPHANMWLAWLDQKGSFSDAYEKAHHNGEAWTADPQQVALHLAGYPNPDRTTPDQIQVFGVDREAVTVIILDENLADDTLSAEEYRVDLVKDRNRWKVEWWGRRWQCRRNFYNGWTNGDTCS